MTNAADDQWGYIPDELKNRYDEEFRSIPNAVRSRRAGFWTRRPLSTGTIAGRSSAWSRPCSRGPVVLAVGVRPGDRVGLWAPNTAGWIVARACSAPWILVPLNTRFKGQETAYVLRKSGASALFAVTDFLDTDYVGMLRAADPTFAAPRPGRTSSSPVRPRRCSCRGRDSSCRGCGSRYGAHAAIDAVTSESLSDIMFTSGTTGYPKGVMAHALSVVACTRLAHEGDGISSRRPILDHPAVLPHLRL